MTGLCVVRKTLFDPLTLGPCSESDGWKYTAQKTLTIQGTYFCLKAQAVGQPAKLGTTCATPNSKWDIISDSKMHLSSKLSDGSVVCLDVDSHNNLVLTNTCKCLDSDRTCDPGTQWFKLVDTTRTPMSAESLVLPVNSTLDDEWKSVSSM